MSVISSTQHSATVALVNEVKNHSTWNGKSVENLTQGSYAITEDSENKFRFTWLNQAGKQISVPFWIDTDKFQWCFMNGQANKHTKLTDMIANILSHTEFFEKKV